MTLILASGPALEPVTLADAKAHLRVDGTDEDALIASLTTAARLTLEAETRRAFISQAWTLVLDSWPIGDVRLPLAPIQALTGVTLVDEDGAVSPVPAALYYVVFEDTARLVRRRDAVWPMPARYAGGIEIAFTAGYGAAASDVPEALRRAVLLLVAHWFENREPVAFGGAASRIPASVDTLVAPYRLVRL